MMKLKRVVYNFFAATAARKLWAAYTGADRKAQRVVRGVRKFHV